MAQNININNVQHNPIQVTASLTAVLNRYYVNTASATYTDPTPTQGQGFIVYVKNGTATIGGTAYSTVGSIIYRYYHSGAWGNTVVTDPSGSYQPLDGDLTSIASLSSTSAYLRRSATNTYVLDSYTTVASNMPSESITSKVLTGYTSAGTILSATDTILSALSALDDSATSNSNDFGNFLSSLPSTQIFVGNAGGNVTARSLTLSAAGGTFALGNTGILTMPNSDATIRGLLTSTDWNTFNGKGNAQTANPLSQFAATTSSQLAGVISDETGSGSLVFGTTPTFTTSIITPNVTGSTSSGGTLTLLSTSHATKGKIFLGTLSVYDQVNDRLGLGTTSPASTLHLYSSGGALNGLKIETTGTTNAGYASVNFSTPTNADHMQIGVYGSAATTPNEAFFYQNNGGFIWYASGSIASRLSAAGRTYFGGNVVATAKVHIAAGSATANTAPLKLTSGTNLTTPENGAFEYDGTNLYFTTGGVRKTVTLI